MFEEEDLVVEVFYFGLEVRVGGREHYLGFKLGVGVLEVLDLSGERGDCQDVRVCRRKVGGTVLLD